MLSNRRILLAVCGSIAAYKTPDIIRRLQDAGAQVRVILSENGARFITELALETVSKHKVYRNFWDEREAAKMPHIELGRWADAILVAPATAETIAKIALGRGDDLLGATILASGAKIFVAPAMNQKMMENAASRKNLATLKNNGATIIEASGEQACGDDGAGRLAEAKTIIEAVGAQFKSGVLSGKNVLITVGATVEKIDPVRFLSNFSSGKMGLAIARACIDAGAKTNLIAANIHEKIPERTGVDFVESADEMHRLVIEKIDHYDIFIATAAVCDYRPENPAAQKIKKEPTFTLHLIENPDILKTVCARDDKPFCVGFAAESENIVDNAQQKRVDKNADVIIANDISKTHIGFSSDQNEVFFITADKIEKIPENSKAKIARKIVEKIAPMCRKFG